MIKLVLLLTLVVAASACSGVKYDKTSSRYRECQREYPNDESACEEYRQAYDKKVKSVIRTPDVQHGDGEMYEK